jgi:hypothetical protein
MGDASNRKTAAMAVVLSAVVTPITVLGLTLWVLILIGTEGMTAWNHHPSVDSSAGRTAAQAIAAWQFPSGGSAARHSLGGGTASCGDGTQSDWRSAGRVVASLIWVTCNDSGTAYVALAHLSADWESDHRARAALPGNVESVYRTPGPAPGLTRAWVEDGNVIVLSVPCPDRSRSTCEQVSASAVRSLSETIPGSPYAPMDRAGRALMGTLLAVPLGLWLIFVGPFRLAVALRGERLLSPKGLPHYRDITTDVTRLRILRFVARLLSLAVGLTVVVVALALFALIKDRTDAPVLIGGIAVLGILLYCRRLVRKEFPDVHRHSPSDAGSGGGAAVGRSLTFTATAGAWTLLTLYLLLIFLAMLGSALTPEFLFGQLDQYRQATDATETARWMLALNLLGAQQDPGFPFALGIMPPLFLLYLVFRLGLRLSSRSMQQALAKDNRPGFIFLRSFGDDQLRLPATVTRKGLLGRSVPLRRRRFEEVLAAGLGTAGPVVAVSPPGTLLAPLGAARTTLPMDDWEEWVRSQSQSALCVVIGATPDAIRPGFGAELRMVAEQLGHQRLMLVVAPVRRREFWRRWSAFLHTVVAREPFRTLGTIPVPEGAQILCRSREQDWCVYGARRRTEASYLLAILEAISDAGAAWRRELSEQTATESVPGDVRLSSGWRPHEDAVPGNSTGRTQLNDSGAGDMTLDVESVPRSAGSELPE